MPEIDLYNDISQETNPPRFAFEKKAMELPIRISKSFKADALKDLPVMDGADMMYIAMTDDGAWPRGFFEKDDMVAYIASNSTMDVGIIVAGHDRAKVEEWLMELGADLPQVVVEDDSVQFSFWNASSSGGSNRYRDLQVEYWKDIKDNYTAPVKEKLDALMKRSKDDSVDSGQLILWHGEPGTGKTHAIRALAREWNEWCEFHYITDPDQFFGHSAGYMIDVLLGHAEKWRLFILEDSGELLSADAAQRSGQGLSRLLNTVDGLIGQGLKILVLVTTNEELGSLHSALSRPGRCLSQAEFKELTAEEADAWLEAHNLEPKGEPRCLVDLYAELSDGEFETRQEKAKLGFG